MKFATGDVLAFKHDSDENKKIVELLRGGFTAKLSEPILDVGAGLGDIAFDAFPEKHVILLDSGAYPSYSLRPRHERLVADFFAVDFNCLGKIGTVCFIHSLQYLDAKPVELQQHILALNPKQIIFVVNTNSGVMGRAVKFFMDEVPGSNPEYFEDQHVPLNYLCTNEVTFNTQYSCRARTDVVAAFEYLMDCKIPSAARAKFELLLNEEELELGIPIEQQIRLYERQ